VWTTSAVSLSNNQSTRAVWIPSTVPLLSVLALLKVIIFKCTVQETVKASGIGSDRLVEPHLVCTKQGAQMLLYSETVRGDEEAKGRVHFQNISDNGFKCSNR